MFKYRLYKVPRSPIWRVGIGRKVRESTKTEDKAAAEVYAQALAERLWRIQQLGDRSAIPFRQTAEKWLNDTASDKTTDRVIIAWLLPKIGDESLSAVADSVVWDQLREDGKEAGWELSSIDRMMTTVSAVLNFAQRRGDLTHKSTLPKYNPKLKEPRFLTEAQFARLLPELPAHTQLWAQFAVLTLLRMRAMLGLTWARVDFRRRVAWIPGDEQKNGDPFTFPLSGAAVQLLRHVKALQDAEYAAYVDRLQARYQRSPSHPHHGKPLPPPPEHVFTYKLKPVDDANTRFFKAACRRAGVPWCTWHILGRHTGASWGAQNGVMLEQRMKQGGWEDMRMALRYSHLEDSHIAAAAEVVAQRLHTSVIVKPARGAKKRA